MLHALRLRQHGFALHEINLPVRHTRISGSKIGWNWRKEWKYTAFCVDGDQQ
jgi:hypothetical protein